LIKIEGFRNIQKVYDGEKTTIYRAVKDEGNLPVIIKHPSNEYFDLTVVEKLKHEFEISKKIQSNRCVKIYEFEYLNNIPVLLIEDFGGISLKHAVCSAELSLSGLIRLAISITEGIIDIHKSGVVHNDINPGNIIVSKDFEVVKITDYGISSLINKEGRALQGTNTFMGTLRYISPEQTGRINRFVDRRSDFYSLGVTLYELMAGKHPYDAEGDLELIHAHLAQIAVPLCEVNKDIPEAVSNIVMKLLEKEPENRYQSAKGLLCDLKKAYSQLDETGKIENFELGKDDIADVFILI
jgi:serine/threonine protein kinase